LYPLLSADEEKDKCNAGKKQNKRSAWQPFIQPFKNSKSCPEQGNG